MDTVKQVLEEIAGGTGKNVNCVDEEELLKLYYRIIKLASLYGVWHNMLREIEFCAQNCCITLPREVEKIVFAKSGNWRPRSRDVRWKYLQGTDGDMDCNSPKMGYEEIGDHFATFTDLKEPMRILAFSDRREDAEAEIIFFAYDEVGREMRLSNEVAPGIPVPLKQASVRSFFSIAKDITTTEKLRTPYQITKSVTRGYVTVYGWDEKANDLVWLTTMAPDEECAEYRRYKFAGTPVSIQALVQLNPIRQFPNSVTGIHSATRIL